MRSSFYDLKMAVRTAKNKPAFSLMVIGMLALGIAGNAAIDHLRRRKRIQWLRVGGLLGTREEPVMPDAHAAVPERDQVRAVLRGMPVEHVTALLLHALEGYSYKEIAQIQGCTMPAVRSRIARARNAFRVAYETKESS